MICRNQQKGAVKSNVVSVSRATESVVLPL